MDSSELLQVLIIEDEPDMASMLKMLLEGEFPASVEIAEDCTSAREKFGSTTFDIITLDYKLPDGDGLELLSGINSMDSPPPVIMVTGQGDERTAADSLKLGASGYVVKDHRLATLLPESIKRILEKEGYRKTLRESEREYRDLVELSRSIILKTDTGGNITFINRFGCEFFGYFEKELVGRNVVSTIVPEVESTGRDLSKMVNDIMADPDAHHPNLNENIRRDGERVWVLWTNRSIRDESGNIIGTLAIGSDFTERMKIEEALRVSEGTLKIIFDSTPALVFFKDKNDCFLRVNEPFSKMLGMPVEEIEGRPLPELFLDQSKDYRKDDLAVIESGVPRLGIIEPVELPGKTIWYQTDKVPYMNADGEIVGIIGFSIDITERKQAEEALREREAHLSSIYEAATDAIILIDNKTIIHHWNPAAKKMFGFTAEEAMGKSVAIVAPEQTRQTYMSAIRSFINSGERKLTAEKPTEMLVAGKHGAEFPVEITTSRFQIGDEWYAAVLARDITDRKQAEEALRKSESQLSLMFANIAEVMFYLSVEPDDRYRFLTVNDAFLKATGLLEKQVVGKYVHEVIPEPSLTLVLEKYKQAIEDNKTVRWEEVTDYPAGRKYGDVAVTPIVDSSGRCTNLLGSVHDVTDRIQDEEALQRVNIELEGYAHTVSHDLKGPLSTASIAFEMLMSMIEKFEMPYEKAELFREIIGAGRSSMVNAHNIIENLLLLAEEAEELQDVAPVSIEETINKVLAENAEMIKEKGITVEVASPLGEVVASPTHIYQLFSNLIRNSIEHNNDKNPAIEISSLGVEDRTHRFLVRDNGQGIPEKILDDVFMRFVKTQSSGTGIGLTIVEKIVKTYSGEIRAYNDKGACFEFTLKDYAGSASA